MTEFNLWSSYSQYMHLLEFLTKSPCPSRLSFTMLNKEEKQKNQVTSYISSTKSNHTYFNSHGICSFTENISESYPAFHSDKLSLFLVTHFCFSVGRLFITFCIRRTVFHSTYPKGPSERMLPACFSTKART